jgi:hypothetical protein
MIEPGWIPQGWERGEPLTIWPADPRGAVFRKLPSIDIDNTKMDDIACFEFTRADAGSLHVWLHWWNPEVYPYE